MSSGITLILSSLTGLGRGQLLYLHLSGLMPASQCLHWHGDKDYALPPARLTGLGHLLVEGSGEGIANCVACMSNQSGLEWVNISNI